MFVFCRIYYQKNEYFSVPQSCAGVFLSDGSNIDTATILSCPALAAVAVNFTSTDCESSFDKICEAAYTDNPPFSCTIDENPDFLTTLGNSCIFYFHSIACLFFNVYLFI